MADRGTIIRVDPPHVEPEPLAWAMDPWHAGYSEGLDVAAKWQQMYLSESRRCKLLEGLAALLGLGLVACVVGWVVWCL